MKIDRLDFEKPIIEIERKIEALMTTAKTDSKVANPKTTAAVQKLQKKKRQLEEAVFGHLSAWQKVQAARHPQRPGAKDYITALFTDFVELHGDRCFGDDLSIVGGLARFEGRPVVVIGQEKGKDIKERVTRNFGMPHPEGYRKARRLMELAEHFNRPMITLVDTPGAYPGADAEARGQAGAIARNLWQMSQLKTPILSVVIGEGGSGGALALSVADVLLMPECAIYSVISPEGCAAILWSDDTKAADAAEALKMTAPDLLKLGVIDAMIPEPPGGAHRDPPRMFQSVKEALSEHLIALSSLDATERLKRRQRRFRKIGFYSETAG